MKINLLKETLDKMKRNDVSPEDVVYVFNSFGYCSWEEFEKWANFDYNNGYGLIAIDLNLIVRGSDWWLERSEYRTALCLNTATDQDITDQSYFSGRDANIEKILFGHSKYDQRKEN